MNVSGFLYQGRSSSRIAVRLCYSGDAQLRFFDMSDVTPGQEQKLIEEFPINSVDISSRIGNTPRFLSFGEQSQFECSDNQAIDELIKAARKDGHLGAKHYTGLAHLLESKTRFIVLTLALVLASSWGFIRYGIPFVSEELAHALPADVSTQIGHGGLEILDRSIFQVSELSEAKQDTLRKNFNLITEKLAKVEKAKLIPMKIEFRKSETLGANAFALPSGTIIFTDDMVELADNTAQLESIMLHEIGHIAHRHSLQQLIQQSSLALFILILSGDISSTSQAILALPGILLQAGYSQKMELEADDFALAHMKTFDLSPEDFIALMEKLEKQHDAEQGLEPNIQQEESALQDYFSSHPSTADRLERFRAHRH